MTYIGVHFLAWVGRRPQQNQRMGLRLRCQATLRVRVKFVNDGLTIILTWSFWLKQGFTTI